MQRARHFHAQQQRTLRSLRSPGTRHSPLVGPELSESFGCGTTRLHWCRQRASEGGSFQTARFTEPSNGPPSRRRTKNSNHLPPIRHLYVLPGTSTTDPLAGVLSQFTHTDTLHVYTW